MMLYYFLSVVSDNADFYMYVRMGIIIHMCRKEEEGVEGKPRN